MNKNKIDWALLVSDYIIDRRTGRLSVINIVNEININKKEPHNRESIIPIDLTLVIAISFDSAGNNEEDIRIRLRNPEGNYGKSESSKIPLPSKRNRIMANIENIRITTEGEYVFEIQLKISGKWKTLFETPLDVLFVNAEKAQFVPIE
jgi:hypothetical protein